MSDTTPEPADKRDDAGPGAPDVEPATAPAASAAADSAPVAADSAAEPHDTDPDMAAPPSGPVSARGHINRPADEDAPATPATPSGPRRPRAGDRARARHRLR